MGRSFQPVYLKYMFICDAVNGVLRADCRSPLYCLSDPSALSADRRTLGREQLFGIVCLQRVLVLEIILISLTKTDAV